jgi:hypothetical protein
VEITSDSLAFRFLELFSKLLNVFPRRLPIGIAGIAVKLESTSTQHRLKLIASKGNRLVVIIGARDFEFGRCGHWLCTSLREKKNGWDRFHVDHGLPQSYA